MVVAPTRYISNNSICEKSMAFWSAWSTRVALMYCDLSRLVPVIYKAFLMMCDVLLSVVLLCCNTQIFAQNFTILLAHVLEKLRPDVERVHYCRWLQTKKYNSAGVLAETLENSVIVAAVGRVLRHALVNCTSADLFQTFLWESNIMFPECLNVF